jgi:hypothetical protein
MCGNGNGVAGKIVNIKVVVTQDLKSFGWAKSLHMHNKFGGKGQKELVGLAWNKYG